MQALNIRMHTLEFFISSAKTTGRKPSKRTRLLKEVVNVLTDLFRFLFIYKMTHTFHYNQVLQKWNVSFEPALGYIILGTERIIGEVLITHDKLDGNFYLSSSPWCGKFPVPATWKVRGIRKKNEAGMMMGKKGNKTCTPIRKATKAKVFISRAIQHAETLGNIKTPGYGFQFNLLIKDNKVPLS